MANDIVPQDDLPSNLVPESDLPDQGPSYDARELVPRALGAGAGAVAGGVGVPVVESGIAKVKHGRVTPPPSLNIPHPSELTPGVSAIDEATGKGVSNAFTQHTREAQVSQRQKSVDQVLKELKAKGVPVNPNLLAEMPTQYAMPGSGIHINVDTAKKIEAENAARAAAGKQLPKDATMAQKFAAKFAPNAVSDVSNFVKGVSEYKLPLVGKVGPLAGHLLGGAATGSQAVDAYNRAQQGDTTGSIISGIGALGTGAATLPTPPIVKGIGAGVGLSAEAINAYRDAMRRGQIQHGAPEAPEQTTPMGDMYAQGGLVYLGR